MKKVTLVFIIFMLNFFSTQLFAQQIFNSVEVRQKFKHKKKYTYYKMAINKIIDDTIVFSPRIMCSKNIINSIDKKDRDYTKYYEQEMTPVYHNGIKYVRKDDDGLIYPEIKWFDKKEALVISMKYIFFEDQIYIHRVFNPKTKQGIKITVYFPANSAIPIKERKKVTYKIEPITDFYE